MTVLTKDNFKFEVEEYNGLVVIDLYADWCGPCRMLAPVIHELENEYTDVKFCKVNVDEEGELAGFFEVMSIPSLFVVKNGEITERSVGALPEARILAMIK